MSITMKGIIRVLGMGLLLQGAVACTPTQQEQTCPEENRVVLDDHKYCVIGQNIIEKGFSCPSDLSYFHDVPGVRGAVCSDQMTLPVGDVEPLKDFVRDDPGTGVWVENTTSPPPTVTCGDVVSTECSVDADCNDGKTCEFVLDAGCPNKMCLDAASTCGGPDPSEQECAVDADCGEGMACVVDEGECISGSCACGVAEGLWGCTADCQEVMVCEPVSGQGMSCGDAPETGCSNDADCGDGESCVASDDTECVPSVCACDENAGVWNCSADCSPNRCVADETSPCSDGSTLVCFAEPPECPAGQVVEIVNGCFGDCVDATTCEPVVAMCGGQPDPSHQPCSVDADCAAGEECAPTEDAVCVPSTCVCDESTGVWGCTEDCGEPLACQPASERPCSDGSEILCDSSEPICPVGQIGKIVNGCYDGCVDVTTCEPAAALCDGMSDPSYQPCDVDADCPAGNFCVEQDIEECVPSTCMCDENLGNVWECTDDCHAPRHCFPEM